MYNADVVIIGAGPVGCVLAQKISTELNLSCLIIEKRKHIKVIAMIKKNKKIFVLYHKYGPHYLRFKNKKIFKYLSNIEILMIGSLENILLNLVLIKNFIHFL